MTENSSWRQVSLVSYGTATLRGNVPLEDWYRHEVFWSARCEFRETQTRALIADDFTLWLDWLKRAGAQRLSLHPVVTLDLPTVAGSYWKTNAIIVHYADRYQIWAHAHESPVADERYNRILNEFDLWESPPPNAAYYSAELDTYLMILERPGSFGTKPTHWPALWGDIESDLELHGVDAHLPDDAAFRAPDADHRAADCEWAQLPLLPKSRDASWANRILRVLVRLSGRFDNDTHPKNEGNLYVGASSEEAAKIQHRGERLHAWISEVQVRAANMDSGAAEVADNTRYVTAPAMPAAEADTAGTVNTNDPSSPTSTPGDPRAENSKWIIRAGWLVALAVVSLLLVAGANLVARFPWLSVLLAALLFAVAKGMRK